jgi:hypothetical protein
VLSMKINYLAEVANFHGQATDTYAYVWMVPGSLFSWITRWNLCHALNRCKVAYFHPMKIGYLAFFHSSSLTISMTFLFSKTWFYLYVYSDNRDKDLIRDLFKVLWVITVYAHISLT